jgi:phosphomannomutase
LDALFSTDGDGDRPLLADENGQWLRGDIVGLLCARELGIKALAVPVSCNTAIETSAAFETVMRTRIGSPYVIEAMESLAGDYSSVAGFEANGGFLLGSEVALGNASLTPLPTRDAVLPVLAVLHAAVVRGQPLSALVNELPERYTASDRLKQVATERSHALLAKWQHNPETMMYDLALEHAIHHLDTTDGLRVNLANGDIVHLRPSGNAPELRCYVESGTMARAEALVAHCLGKIESLEY